MKTAGLFLVVIATVQAAKTTIGPVLLNDTEPIPAASSSSSVRVRQANTGEADRTALIT